MILLLTTLTHIIVLKSTTMLFMSVIESVRCLEFISSHLGCLAKMALMSTDIHVIKYSSLDYLGESIEQSLFRRPVHEEEVINTVKGCTNFCPYDLISTPNVP